ncbi:tetraacyldisaccharide 4'-kinase [Pontibacter silvestris]|nr:tetraacyldisaccharide 4'-kinase [Pontibacter silvestris]
MNLRNFLYDKGLLESQGFNLPVIVVGNLTVGGTGKTPHVEYLLRLFNVYKSIATLSRGYKRNTRGFVLADVSATAATIGDEPFQYYQDHPNVHVAVCEDRVKGIEQLQHLFPELNLVILDDAMQHRPVQPSFNILITDYNRLFYKDYVMPAGLLREPRKGANRADAVVVSKCPPNMDKGEMQRIKDNICKYTKPDTPVFFSCFRYGLPVAVGAKAMLKKKAILVTGIANPAPLKSYLNVNGYTIFEQLSFSDHHQYTLQNIIKLQELLKNDKYKDAVILTTSKDAVKLTGPDLVESISRLPVFYVPIEVQFLQNAEAFDRLVLQHIQSFLKY